MAAPRERATVIRDGLPGLLVDATGDPRTAYRSAVVVRRTSPRSRRVTLRDADRHAAYAVVTCRSDQPLRVKTLSWLAPLEQSFFSSAVILRDLTTTALRLPSVPFGAGPVITSGTNQ